MFFFNLRAVDGVKSQIGFADKFQIDAADGCVEIAAVKVVSGTVNLDIAFVVFTTLEGEGDGGRSGDLIIYEINILVRKVVVVVVVVV